MLNVWCFYRPDAAVEGDEGQCDSVDAGPGHGVEVDSPASRGGRDQKNPLVDHKTVIFDRLITTNVYLVFQSHGALWHLFQEDLWTEEHVEISQ